MADAIPHGKWGTHRMQYQHKSMEVMLKDLKAQNADLKEAYGAIKSSLDRAMANNHQGSVNIAKLVDEINASNKYIKQLVEAKSKSDSLNMVLTNNLTRSLNTDELRDVDVKVLKGSGLHIPCRQHALQEREATTFHPRRWTSSARLPR